MPLGKVRVEGLTNMEVEGRLGGNGNGSEDGLGQ